MISACDVETLIGSDARPKRADSDTRRRVSLAEVTMRFFYMMGTSIY